MSTAYATQELGRIARFEYGKSQTTVRSLDGTIPVYGTGGLMEFANAFLHPGPSVIVGRKGSLGNPLFSEGPFWAVDTTYYAAECNGSMRWLHYVLCSLRLENYSEATGVPSLARPTLNGIRVPCPSPDEQDGIVRILSTIDQAIEQTEALLAKQQRIKTGLMHDLLTRGLDAQGRLRDASTHTFKPSPLGPIPSEWAVVNVEDLCDDIVDCPHSTPKYETGGFPCIRTADMVPGRLLLQNAFRVSPCTYQERIARLAPRRGDIIYSREGERLGIASPVEDEPVCLGQRVMLLRPKAETNSTFMTWAMNSPSFYNRVVLGQIATTSPHINVRDIKKALVVRPEPSEQQLIGEALAADDEDKIKLLGQVEKLHRLKIGLMHDLLTGRVLVTPLLPKPTTFITP